MTLVGQQQAREHVPHIEALRADTVELLNDLTAQIENFRRIFAGAFAHAPTAPAREQSTDVVFVDDLAKCMDCSWARLEAASGRPTADIVAQCSRFLETSLQILQQVQQLQAGKTSPPDTDG